MARCRSPIGGLADDGKRPSRWTIHWIRLASLVSIFSIPKGRCREGMARECSPAGGLADHGKRQVAPALDVSLGEFTNLGIGVRGKGVPGHFFGG